MPNRSSLLPNLRAALLAAQHPLQSSELQALPDTGLAHDHVRLLGSGWLARIPKQSQMGLDAVHNLAYQRACFERAGASGHTPRLHGLLAPSQHLPRGALLVQEIVGRPARLPHDLGAIVAALAAIHALPLPAASQRAPLLDAPDPLRDVQQEMAAQAQHLTQARVAPAVLRAIASQRQALAAHVDRAARPTRHLIAFDGHPGNFLVRADGSAVLVDLEKCRYSHPGLDLAHATLYTSTTWDLASHAVLSLSEVAQAYRLWGQALGLASEAVSDAALPWAVPLRRAMWLWSVTWCAKWRVLSDRAVDASARGEDWSVERSDSALVCHVRERVDHYLSAPVVERMLQEFDALEQLLGA